MSSNLISDTNEGRRNSAALNFLYLPHVCIMERGHPASEFRPMSQRCKSAPKANMCRLPVYIITVGVTELQFCMIFRPECGAASLWQVFTSLQRAYCQAFEGGVAELRFCMIFRPECGRVPLARFQGDAI